MFTIYSINEYLSLLFSAPANRRKERKRNQSQETNGLRSDRRTTSVNYVLPPVKNPRAKSRTQSRHPPSTAKCREPCPFRSSYAIEAHVGTQSRSANWVHSSGFKPFEKKKLPKSSFTSESDRLKIGSITKLFAERKTGQENDAFFPTNDVLSSDSIQLPAIRGSTRTSRSTQSLPPKAQYINIYRDDAQLPPLRVSAMSINKTYSTTTGRY